MHKLSSDPAKWTDEELSWILPFVGARILGLGEVVHTSDGFYSAKVRLIQYLIEHHNFRAIAFETPWGKSLSASEFVQEGKGSIETALKGLFRVWRAKSVERLLIWLRKWNMDHPDDPVRFFGNDTQQADWDLQCLLSSPLVNPAAKDKIKTIVTTMFGAGIFAEGFKASEEFKKLLTHGFTQGQDLTSEIVETLKGLQLGQTTVEYTANLSLSAYLLGASKDINGTAKNLPQLRAEAFAHRDECMSDLVLRFSGNSKTILWAHNYHICRPAAELVDGLYFQGQFLKRTLAQGYKAIALTAGRVETNWPWLPSHMQPFSIPENSLEVAVTSLFPDRSVFLTSIENMACTNYCQEFNLKQDGDISARFDGILVLPESRAIEYAV